MPRSLSCRKFSCKSAPTVVAQLIFPRPFLFDQPASFQTVKSIQFFGNRFERFHALRLPDARFDAFKQYTKNVDKLWLRDFFLQGSNASFRLPRGGRLIGTIGIKLLQGKTVTNTSPAARPERADIQSVTLTLIDDLF